MLVRHNYLMVERAVAGKVQYYVLILSELICLHNKKICPRPIAYIIFR